MREVLLQTRQGQVLCRPVNDRPDCHEFVGIDSKGGYHICYEDPSDSVEAMCAAQRKDTHGKILAATTNSLSMHKVAELPAVVAAAHAENFNDPEWMRHYLRRHPEYRTYDEGSSLSKRFTRKVGEGKSGNISGIKAAG